ncbi:hypothetical protein [Streptomyces sp. NPDC091371]|uniref:hypothetical protein n=1 Tax=Streptomyces sp. NPDC091371 TaxID=3155303 RepID=UPI0034307121
MRTSLSSRIRSRRSSGVPAGTSRPGRRPLGRPVHDRRLPAEQTTAVHRQAAEVVAGLRERGARCIASDGVAAGASRASAEEGALLLREVVRMTAAASATRNCLHGEMESAGGTLHLVYGDGREIEPARSLARAGHLTLLITTADVDVEENLFTVRLPRVADAVRVVLETVVRRGRPHPDRDPRGSRHLRSSGHGLRDGTGA